MAIRAIVTFRSSCSSTEVRDMNVYLGTFGSGTHNFVKGRPARLYVRDDRDLAILEDQFAPVMERITRLLGKAGRGTPDTMRSSSGGPCQKGRVNQHNAT